MPLTIQELPVGERPRERLRNQGSDAVSTTELLAIILGGGSNGKSAVDVAGHLLAHHGGSLRSLSRAEPAALEQVVGIGPARSAAVVAALALGRRLASEPARTRDQIMSPADVFGRLAPFLRDRKQEEFWVIYLDTQNRIILERRLTVGLLNTSLVHPREVFGPAIATSCASIILCHNHPSGEPEPSAEDIAVTVQLVESGRLLGIPVRDHIILGDREYVSLCNRGLCD